MKNIMKTEYILNKRTFLNDIYNNECTKESYMNSYMNKIHGDEVAKGKDLMNFTTTEIEDMLISLVTSSPATRGALLSFITKYLDYCVDKGYIITNQASSISGNTVRQLSKKVAHSKRLNLKDFYKLVNKVYVKENSHTCIVPVLLARYGIIGKAYEDMINVKFEDIDTVNKVVRINKKDEIKLIKVDDDFINWIYKISNDKYGAVLKNSKGKVVTSKNTIQNMFNNFFVSVGISRMCPKILRENRKLDLLESINNVKVVNMKDIEIVEELISYDNDNSSRTGILRLRNLYETTFGIEVVG